MQAKSKKPYYQSREMRALEANAEYYGISLLQLMENAGRSIAQEIISTLSKGKENSHFLRFRRKWRGRICGG